MKYVFTVLIFVVVTEVSAQTAKGSWMIGGSIRVQRSAVKYVGFDQSGYPSVITSKSGSFSASPNVGYFLVKNLMVGAQIDYSYSWYPDTENNRYNSLGIGPMARYYYFPVEKLALFPEIGYRYALSKYKSFDSNTGTIMNIRSTTTSFHGGIGAAWFVSPNIGIEGILAYQNVDQKKTESGDSRNLYFNIGIQFYLPKKE